MNSVNPILKFIVYFLISYSVLSMVLSSSIIGNVTHSFVRSTVTATMGFLFSKAFIESQDIFDDNNQKIPSKMFLVFGNPKTIQNELDYARLNQISEVKVSTRSTQFFLFELFTVPLVFLLSMFIATPMDIKRKLKNLSIAAAILFLFLLVKCFLITHWAISSNHIGIYEISSSRLQALNRTLSFLSLGFSIMTALLLWFLMGYRNSVFASQFNSFIDRYSK